MTMSMDDRLRNQQPFLHQATRAAWFKDRHPPILHCLVFLPMMEVKTCGDGGEKHNLAAFMRRLGVADLSEMVGPHLA